MDNLTTLDNRDKLIEATLNTLQSQHSRRAYKRALTTFKSWHTANGMPQLNKALVSDYKTTLERQDKGASVINQHLCAIRAMVREAADNGLIDPAIAAGIANIKGVKSETVPSGRDIKPSEISAILGACDSSLKGIRDAAMLALMYGTGTRRMSIVGLDFEDYESETGRIIFRAAKGNKDITTYLPEGAAAALNDWLAIRGREPGAMFYPIHKGGRIVPQRLTTQAVWHIVQERAKDANLNEPITPHDFRRSFVGDMIDAGADPFTVSKMVGHTSIQTTLRYDRRPDRAKAKAAGLLHVPYFSR